MIIVLADDFSGAAEMGGIGSRYGLTTMIQAEPIIRKDIDLLVIDTDTRALTENAAIERIKEICHQLKNYNKPFKLFKKVDSVMRGHIAAETTVLQEDLGYERILLLPANPGRQRKIISGEYYVNDVLLNKSVFASDPDFPAHSSSVKNLLSQHKFDIPHVHIQQRDDLPIKSFITADIETKEDIDKYIRKTNDKDLCAGAAECFEAWLEKQGFSVVERSSIGKSTSLKRPFTVILNGSTVKDIAAEALLETIGVPQLSLPAEWREDRFIIDGEKENLFHHQVLQLLKERSVVSVTVDKPVKELKKQPDFFSACFVKLMHYISGSISMNDIHFCLTGGATSVAVTKSAGIQDLYVKDEVVPGIVTLESLDKIQGLFTVKPGSYPWPKSFLENLANSN